ncbi:MAG TPA: hypothetical protein VHK63_09935 [Candidatus Limnocylindria bacterium]|nr:hypothetical protein [Candidatus Limnocylindria bacterium]
MINGDDDLAAAYSARGVPTDWIDLTFDNIAPAFRLYYRALPSPDPDAAPSAGKDEAELLLHDPVAALRAGGIIGEEVDDAGRPVLPRIATMVVNHEKTLKRFVMHAFVTVSNNPHTIGITIVKEEKQEGTEQPQS